MTLKHTNIFKKGTTNVVDHIKKDDIFSTFIYFSNKIILTTLTKRYKKIKDWGKKIKDNSNK